MELSSASPARHSRRGFWFGLGCLLFCIKGVCSGENLVTVRTVNLPAFASEDVNAILVAAERPLLVQNGRAWVVEEGSSKEAGAAWSLNGRLLGSVANGRLPFMLVGESGSSEIVRVVADPASGVALRRPLPDLPAPLADAHGAILSDVLYLAGKNAAGAVQCFAISLRADDPTWNSFPSWNEPSAKVTAVVAQDSALYVAVRAQPNATTGDQLWRWTAKDGWALKGDLPGTVADGAARPVGQAHVLFLVNVTHPAGSSQLVTFHTLTATFSFQGVPMAGAALRGVPWGNGFLWQAASTSAAATGTFRHSEIVGSKLLLRPLDWLMMVIYLAGIAGIGVYCYRKEKKNSTANFFVGNRTIPFWAAGISLYATNSSAIGYISTTAKAFATNWQYLLGNLLGAVGLVFVAIWIVPLLRRLELMSVFTYLDQRFHKSVRLWASAFCIIMHLGGRLSVILFLPSLAIATITGLNVIYSILIMGTVTMIYTALGGMRAVIWTDLAQVVVKVGGLIFAVGYIISRLDGGLHEFVSTVQMDHKMKMFDWSFDLTKATVWCFLFLTLFETVLTFPKDQILMQRVFTTKSEKEAGRSVWVYAVMVIPGSMLFYLIGSGLYVFYHSHPERMNPLLPIDATFPLFIAAELPAGVTGLMIAGLFSAAMGTSSSIMNSVSTMVSVDFYEKIAKKPNPRFSIRLAEWVTVGAGLIGVGLAILLSRLTINSFLDTSIELVGLFGGSFGGAYTLGMFTRRANWQGVLIGMVVSFVGTFVIWWFKAVHPFLYLAASILISIVVGYVASLFYPAPSDESLRGLTIRVPKAPLVT